MIGRWDMAIFSTSKADRRKTRTELNAIPNFGQKSIEEVIETLHSRGLDLQGE